MTNFVPIFPLNIVVYPGEALNLHIFEPRYKQLVEHCIVEKKPFGIPCFLNNKIHDMGTLVQIQSVETTYDNGEMDIKTIATEIFIILEVIHEIPHKLYKGAIVNYPTNTKHGLAFRMKEIILMLKKFHAILQIEKKYKKPDDELNTYDIAHHVGFSLAEEVEFLSLLNEIQRQEYIYRHLQKTMPMMKELESLKERIKLNGHFKKLSLNDFDF